MASITGTGRGKAVRRWAVFVVASLACATSLAACVSDGGSTPDFAELEATHEPYYYVGRSFDGLQLSNVRTYDEFRRGF